MADSFAADRRVLALCLVLETFDREVLLELGDVPTSDVDALLGGSFVLPSQRMPGLWCLTAAALAMIGEHLQEQPSGLELMLHQRSFDYFLGRWRAATDEVARDDAERRCFHHLNELSERLSERREWTALAELLAAVRASRPRLQRQQQLLALHEGWLAVRTNRFEHGEAQLLPLLTDPVVDDWIRVRVLRAIGLSAYFKTEYDRARSYCEQFLELARAIGDAEYEAGALNNLSLIENELGAYAQAIARLSDSLAIFRRLGDVSRQALVLWNIGNNELQLGRWADAERRFDEAIAIYEQLGVEASLAHLYWCKGYLAHLLGDQSRSEAMYKSGLEIAEGQQHGDTKAAMDLWANLGLLYQTQQRWLEALPCYERAIALATTLNDRHLHALVRFRLAQTLQQLGASGVWDMFDSALSMIEGLRASSENEEIALGLIGTTQQMYEAAVVFCLERGDTAGAFRTVERARSRAFLDMFLRKNAPGEPDFPAFANQRIADLAELQHHLPDDAVLLEFFTIGVVPHGEHILNRLPAHNTSLREVLVSPAQILRFAITRTACEAAVVTNLDPNHLRPQPHDPDPGRHIAQRDRLMTMLYGRLIAPVEHLLAGRRLVWIVPHGPLHYVPFVALRSAGSFPLARADGPALAYAPSASVLLRACLDRLPSLATTSLALGYNDDGSTALRYAEAEAAIVAELSGGQVWAGATSKSERLPPLAPSLRRLHFAGHAVFDSEDPLASRLKLGPGDSIDARWIMRELDLDAELVTLSACTSGLSAVVSGDELLGLQRAFLYAGARTVVCTLWEADDTVAVLLMDHFYRRLAAGLAPAQALLSAQLAIREMPGAVAARLLERLSGLYATAVADNEIDTLAQQEAPFARPETWATFLLIGRP